MTSSFRPFRNKDEEADAGALLATIDKSEKWIFDGAKGQYTYKHMVSAKKHKT